MCFFVVVFSEKVGHGISCELSLCSEIMPSYFLWKKKKLRILSATVFLNILRAIRHEPLGGAVWTVSSVCK